MDLLTSCALKQQHAAKNVVQLKWFGPILECLYAHFQALGNHEFDFGTATLNDNFLASAEFPVLAANIDFAADPNVNSSLVQKSIIVEKAGKCVGHAHRGRMRVLPP